MNIILFFNFINKIINKFVIFLIFLKNKNLLKYKKISIIIKDYSFYNIYKV